jgi:acetolactate synthase small subunit
MKNLKTYLKEEKNTHMEHLEDLIFNEGLAGTKQAIKFLSDLRDMLASSAKSKVTSTVKWDGAPAIFAGIDPRDGKFFIAKKGIFNKEPKVYKTAAEIDADTDGDLAAKFKVALQEFSKLGIKKGVYQGDLMFTQQDLKIETIEGSKYVTFHPNTIVYAVPAESDLAKQIKKAKIGVVWHTTYTGNTFETMSATFGKGIVDKFKNVSSIWMDDANYKDYSGTATFTKAETTKLDSIIKKADALVSTIQTATLNGISQNPELLILVKTFANSKIRAGEKITDTSKYVTDLFNYIHDKLEPKQKTEKGKAAGEAKRKEIIAFFANHDKKEIVKIFDLANILVDAKHMIVDKMNQAGHISTFLKTNSGFKVTDVEGFVAIDHLTGGAVKIVNRMEFSQSNFSPDIIKGWQR